MSEQSSADRRLAFFCRFLTMKGAITLKRIFSSIMVVALVLAVFAGCGGGNNFTCADVVNSSANQQRWIKSFDSNIVVNPNAIGAESYTEADEDMSLDLGILAEDGSVAKTLDDVVFFLETSVSNGKGGEEIWAADFTPGAENVRGVARLDNNSSDGRMFSASVPEDKTFNIKGKNPVEINFIDDIYMIMDVGSISAESEFTVVGIPNRDLQDFKVFDDIAAAGTYVAEITEAFVTAFESNESKAGHEIDKTTPVTVLPQFSISNGMSLLINNWSIRSIPLSFQKATKAMRNTWYPYQIVSSQEFDYGMALTTTDMITGESAVTRKVVCDLSGNVYVAGYLNGGTATYNEKNSVVTVTGDGFEYSICVKRAGDIAFYDSEEDMLTNTAPSAEPKATSQYWTISQTSYNVGETYNIGVAASLTAGTTTSAAKDAASAATLKKFEANAVDKWDEFIAANDVTDYIVNIPQE